MNYVLILKIGSVITLFNKVKKFFCILFSSLNKDMSEAQPDIICPTCGAKHNFVLENNVSSIIKFVSCLACGDVFLITYKNDKWDILPTPVGNVHIPFNTSEVAENEIGMD